MVRMTIKEGNMRWEIASSLDKDYIIALAKEKGWAENKVQVKKHKGIRDTWYIIEPYEEDCGCPQLLRYEDYK